MNRCAAASFLSACVRVGLSLAVGEEVFLRGTLAGFHYQCYYCADEAITPVIAEIIMLLIIMMAIMMMRMMRRLIMIRMIIMIIITFMMIVIMVMIIITITIITITSCCSSC